MAQFEVSEADLTQGVKFGVDFWDSGEELAGLIDGLIEHLLAHLGDPLAVGPKRLALGVLELIAELARLDALAADRGDDLIR